MSSTVIKDDRCCITVHNYHAMLETHVYVHACCCHNSNNLPISLGLRITYKEVVIFRYVSFKNCDISTKIDKDIAKLKGDFNWCIAVNIKKVIQVFTR